MNVYAIYDKKTEEYSTPFFQLRDPNAVRTFQTAVNHKDANNSLNLFPADYDLVKIGTWDNQNGILEGHRAEPLCNGLSVITKPENANNG